MLHCPRLSELALDSLRLTAINPEPLFPERWESLQLRPIHGRQYIRRLGIYLGFRHLPDGQGDLWSRFRCLPSGCLWHQEAQNAPGHVAQWNVCRCVLVPRQSMRSSIISNDRNMLDIVWQSGNRGKVKCVSARKIWKEISTILYFDIRLYYFQKDYIRQHM